MLVPGKELPGPFGTKIPVQNAGDLKTKGWELRLSWRDSKELSGSPFWYNVAFTLADSRSWITRFDNPTKSLGDQWDRNYVGREIGEIWGADITGFLKMMQQQQLRNNLPWERMINHTNFMLVILSSLTAMGMAKLIWAKRRWMTPAICILLAITVRDYLIV
ncbi:hypothetical protein [Sphingobacterium sp. E70]|uniref:hypothetical protein n=1 Tax=Sphingobacterium sp. E70 TaxID=2853439 RepID=UPI00211B7C76|nr:hypothetical protein [Sphingobacterium sp. E70]